MARRVGGFNGPPEKGGRRFGSVREALRRADVDHVALVVHEVRRLRRRPRGLARHGHGLRVEGFRLLRRDPVPVRAYAAPHRGPADPLGLPDAEPFDLATRCDSCAPCRSTTRKGRPTICGGRRTGSCPRGPWRFGRRTDRTRPRGPSSWKPTRRSRTRPTRPTSGCPATAGAGLRGGRVPSSLPALAGRTIPSRGGSPRPSAQVLRSQSRR